ncbi:Uma2 family endonuclease [Larkinella sp. GY13]|uniref:Uma2 family endonuclease n=1 Tax=Larkinella sp. GY13 TaxID=3453720 RepID=UPI003EE9E97F
MATITDFSQLDLTKKYTYADYLTWQLDEWVELIKGKVARMSPAPKRIHQAISFNLSRILGQRLKGNTCRAYAAPFDVRLTTMDVVTNEAIETVVQPDISVICDPAKLDEQGCIGAPDWIIEILSPGSMARDTKEKFDLYEENGVKEYWIVAPGEKNISVFVLEGDRYQLVADFYQPGLIPVRTLADFSIEWGTVFEDL